MARPRIAIVGAGPAGLAAAIAISRRIDAELVVFERASSLTPAGAGVLVQPIGLAVLDRLGLGDAVRSAGSRVERLLGTSHDGRIVLDLEYARLDPAAYGIGIARYRLHRVLVDAFRSSGARLELATEVTAIDRAFDLTVLADGARSSLRDAALPGARVTRYPWSAVWTTVPVAVEPLLRQHFRAAREMLGILPSGDARDGEPALATVFWSLEPAGHATWRAASIDQWKDRVLALAPACDAWLDHIVSHEQFAHARYFDARIAKPVGARHVAIGDCAHATSPQLGQGVNLALLDAWALAGSLARHGVGRDALDHYAARRRAHVRYYQWASRVLTPLFQSHGSVLPWLRDRFAAFGMSLPYVRRHALATLAGTKTGILRAARDCDALLDEEALRS